MKYVALTALVLSLSACLSQREEDFVAGAATAVILKEILQ